VPASVSWWPWLRCSAASYLASPLEHYPRCTRGLCEWPPGGWEPVEQAQQSGALAARKENGGARVIAFWPQIAFWLAAFVALVLLGAGIVTRRWRVSAAGCAISLPFLFYLLLTPLFRYWALGVIVLNCVSVVALARGYRWLALAMVAPFVGIAVWLASAASTH
jgi:hypothetical protein